MSPKRTISRVGFATRLTKIHVLFMVINFVPIQTTFVRKCFPASVTPVQVSRPRRDSSGIGTEIFINDLESGFPLMRFIVLAEFLVRIDEFRANQAFVLFSSVHFVKMMS